MSIYLFNINEWKYFEFADGSTIGRSTGDLVYPKDGMMSGTHLKFHLVSGETEKVFIEDLNSKNGTFLNKEKIPSAKLIELLPHTLLEVGFQKFLLTHTPNLKVDFVNNLISGDRDKAANIQIDNAKQVVETFRKNSHEKLEQLEAEEISIKDTILSLGKEIEKIQSDMQKFKSIKEIEDQKFDVKKAAIIEQLEKEKMAFLKELDKKKNDAFLVLEAQKSKSMFDAEKMIPVLTEKMADIKSQIRQLETKATQLKKDIIVKKKKLERYGRSEEY